jgi:glycerol-3-phosphate dehydrogenase
MVETVEDILARRTRALFLNAKAAIELAPQIAEIMAQELQKEFADIWIQEQIQAFNETARNYLVKPSE